MRTPLRNPKIFHKINDSAKSKDKDTQRKQRSLVKYYVSNKNIEIKL